MKKFIIVALALMASPFMRLWDKIDRRLCTSLPVKLRVWWCALWERQDEFHPCYDLDGEAIIPMNQQQTDDYILRIIKRRNIVHGYEADPPLLQ